MKFKIGDKLKCVKEEKFVFIELNEIVEVIGYGFGNPDFDITVSCASIQQVCNSKNFEKVGK